MLTVDIDVDKGHRHHQWIWCIGSATEDDWRAKASEEEVMRGDAEFLNWAVPGHPNLNVLRLTV
jgi:hypothetical protein